MNFIRRGLKFQTTNEQKKLKIQDDRAEVNLEIKSVNNEESLALAQLNGNYKLLYFLYTYKPC